MKKFNLIIPAALLVLASCGNNSELTIKGKTDGDTESIYVVANGGADTLAVVPVVNGAFTATVPVTEPGFIYLREDDRNLASVIAEPGKLNLEVTGQQFKATGTPLNDIYNKYREDSRALYDEYRSATDDAAKEEVIVKMNDLDKSFLNDNTANWLGVYALTQSQYELSAQELLDAIDALGPKFADNKDVVKIKGRAETMMKSEVGNKYMDIKLPSPKGTEISLSETVASNKYVLLDFWASWCGPCMGEVPYLVKDYAEYHSKGFEIYGVSLDRTAEPWTEAIEVNKMNWIHVSDLKFWECAPAGEYGVYSIPANFLIDSNGTIIARNLRGEALGNKLAELLGE